jgi:hypothetical protein
MTEEELYTSLINKKIWTIQEFACLVVGITPRKLKKMMGCTSSQITKEEVKRVRFVRKIMHRLITGDKGSLRVRVDDFLPGSDEPCMSSWKFIKWLAENERPMMARFIRRLPLDLLEMYLFFLPSNSPLRTKSRYSREYHRAVYLERAKDLKKRSAQQLTHDEIYREKGMLNLLRAFEKSKGVPANYKKRTITGSWLPRLEKRQRGRPKKS